MDNGISITNFAISGTALAALGGVVGAWIKARYGRTEITPQPLEVRDASDRSLAEHVADNRSDHSNLFSRMSHAEQRVSALEACSVAQSKQLDKIDTKLDRVLERLP